MPAYTKKPIKVCVTGGAGNIAGIASFLIAKGTMLGDDQPIELRLLEIPPMEKKMSGVVMELNDGAFPLLKSVIGTTDYKVAFQDVEMVLMIGAKPRAPGMVRADLLKANAQIFEGQGKALDKYASRTVKVVVVGNPANTNCLIAMTNAPSLHRSCFSALTRLDQNRAVSALAARLKCPTANVKNIVIWGNHSKTQYPDVNQAFIEDYPQPGLICSARACAADDEWLDGPYMKKVQMRGAEILAARGKSSAASAANATIDHMRSWHLGTAPGEVVSMAIPTDGSYGVPNGLVFSFPVTITDRGVVSIVQGLSIDARSQVLLNKTTNELLDERVAALGPQTPRVGPQAKL